MYPQELHYSKTHEWVKVEGKTATVGISQFAVESLTDITYLNFDVKKGDSLSKGDAFGVVESVKATGDIYMPVSGKVLEIHKELANKLESLVAKPYEDGWMLKIEMSNPAEWDQLLTAQDYEKVVAEEKHKH